MQDYRYGFARQNNIRKILGMKKKVTTKNVAHDIYGMFMECLRWEHERTPEAVQKFKEEGIEIDREALSNEMVPIYLLFLDVITKSTFSLQAIKILEEFFYILEEDWSKDQIDAVFASLQGYIKVWDEALETTDPDATELLKDPVYRVTKLACERVVDNDPTTGTQLLGTHAVVHSTMLGLAEMFEDYSKRHEVA